MKDYSNRNISFDILRIISAISIVLMHLTSGNLYSLEIGSAGWTTSALINSVSHFGVPIFVMISGALFLSPGKEIDIKKLWINNILRITVCFVLWSFIYGIVDFVEYRNGFKGFIWCAIVSRPHLWFLPMIIGLYIISPILLRWVKSASEAEIRYFIIIFIVFQIGAESLKAFHFADMVDTVMDMRNITLVCSYAGYFVIGYYIVHIGLKKVTKKILYILGGLGLASSIFLLIFVSIKHGIAAAELVDSYMSFTFFYSVSLFSLIFDLFKDRKVPYGLKWAVSEVGIDTFGLYLSHLLIIENIPIIGRIHDAMPLAAGILFYCFAVVLIGILGSALARRIPFVGRYIC